MISRTNALYNKELMHFFQTPSAYIVIGIFLLLSGYFFATPMFLSNQADINSFLDVAPLLLTFFAPAVSMRVFSDEFRAGTIEILMTMPVKPFEIVLSKFLSAFTVMAMAVVFTCLYPFTISALGNLDVGAVLSAYLGLFLTSALFCSAGVFASSLSKNQVVAFITGFLICFALHLAGKVYSFMPGKLAGIAQFLGTDIHYGNLARGVVDSRDVVYYLLLTGFFVFLSHIKLLTMRKD